MVFIYRVSDFNRRTTYLNNNILKQKYWYHNLRKAFSEIYLRHYELIKKYHVCLALGYPYGLDVTCQYVILVISHHIF